MSKVSEPSAVEVIPTIVLRYTDAWQYVGEKGDVAGGGALAVFDLVSDDVAGGDTLLAFTTEEIAEKYRRLHRRCDTLVVQKVGAGGLHSIVRANSGIAMVAVVCGVGPLVRQPNGKRAREMTRVYFKRDAFLRLAAKVV
jgi:hypothetical protein